MPAQNKISLLVPCFNASAYIDTFLKHIAAIDFFEVIFYNDGSNDNTLEILINSGCKYLTSDINNGPGFARNRLAKAATCDYIHFHDIDDKFNPDFIKLVNERIITQPDVILGNADWIDERTGDLLIHWKYDEKSITNNALDYFISKPLGIINTVYKRSFFLNLGGFNEKIKCWEDADIHIRMAAKKATFEVIDQTLAYSIRHDHGISKNQEWCWECRFQYLKKYLAELPVANNKSLMSEFSKCAQVFYDQKKFDIFIECCNICKKHNVLLPATNNKILNLLKKLNFSPRALYYIQNLARK